MRSSVSSWLRVATVAVLATLMLGALLVAPASAATVTSFSPPSGPPGTTVTITGTFGTATAVTFNGVPALSFSTVNATTVTAVVPAGATDGQITVTDAGGPGTSAASFDVTSLPAPTITSFSPVCGDTGATVTISGTNLIGVDYDLGFVKFNGVDASAITVVSPTQVTATVPGAATTGPITVRSEAAAGESGAIASGPYPFVKGTCGVTVSSISPTSGPIGTSVTIIGTGFPVSSTCQVTFTSNRTATGTTNSAGTQITVVVPTGTVTGPALVACTTGGALTPTFTVTTAPTITSFTPTSGPVGTVVTITGTNFTGVTSVKFNNVTATFTFNSATQITATVPNSATTGKITVTTPAGTATSAADFSVTDVSHARSVSLQLKGGSLKATGAVNVNDGFAACERYVPVKIQKQSSGEWQTLELLATNKDGKYSGYIPNKSGKYRAKAIKITLQGGDICGGDTSPVRKN